MVFKNITMHWVVVAWLITSLFDLGQGHNTLFEGYERTLSGYHLCNVTESVLVTHVISYPSSYTQRRLCGGWLPWMMCDVTLYKTEYRTEVYDTPKQVRKCCHGYEQVGSYCALTLNRSAEFTSKPGLCPSTEQPGSSGNNSYSFGSMCKWDFDCPHWQKCCESENTSNIFQCTDPEPPANRPWCFNATVTVKMTYELLTKDDGLFNHTRLLHSVVTGVLGNHDFSVHHVWSWTAGLFTTSSSLLVCSSKAVSLEDTTTKLYQLGNIEEVTNVVVQDVDECAALWLNTCSPHADCVNTVGSYSCFCHHGYQSHDPSQPGAVCVDVDECVAPELSNCSTHADCVNTAGSYSCSCSDGFQDHNPSQPGTVCVDVDECASPELNNCSTHANCANTAGSYACSCHHGYQDHNASHPGTVCMDVDECAAPELSNCSTHANCTNTAGSYSCSCHQGYLDHNPSQPGTVCVAPTIQPFTYTSNATPSWTTHPPLPDYIPEIASLFSYNVTGSSFDVSWTTDTQAGVTFLVVLRNGTTSQSWNVMSFNWTFTHLNPAVLYTVRVTPLACGNHGNPMEIKVRTDGESLEATARLTNRNYTEALNNHSSAEYKALCDSVINETLSSLAPEIRLLVETGVIVIQITSFSPGSVIVNFSIKFQPGNNLNSSSVSTTLLQSLKNSSKYLVDNIHIKDIDECLLSEADCSPWAHCTNNFGSYICDCWSGYTDLSPSRPGRSCAALSGTTTFVPPATSTKNTSGHPSMTITTTTTRLLPTVLANNPTTALTAVNHNPLQFMAPDITSKLISNITVKCKAGSLLVGIHQDLLDMFSIPVDTLYLGKPECGFRERTENGSVWFSAAWSECGVRLDHNGTHYLVSVTLYNNVSSSTVRLKVPVICTYPSLITVSTGYAPTGYFDIITDPVSGFGTFQIIMRLLNGTFPLAENNTLSPDDEVVVEVGVNTTTPQIKVVINKCWATADSNSAESPNYMFLKDGCPMPKTFTSVIQNGNDTVSLVSVRIFSFVDLDSIYLHCQIQICVEIQADFCLPVCLRLASYTKSSNFIGMTKASIGPLNRAHTPTLQKDRPDTLLTVGFVLLGVGVFLLSLAVITGLVYHKRKIGNYNFRFKPQPENFTYHVFDT